MAGGFVVGVKVITSKAEFASTAVQPSVIAPAKTRDGACQLGALGVIGVLWNGDCGQDADNRDNDHEFDQGKTSL